MTDFDQHIRYKHASNKKAVIAARHQIPEPNTLNYIAQFFGLLSDPTRLKIVIALKITELCVHEISETIGLSISAVSHQLRLLKTAKMVKSRRAGKMVYYSLDDEHIEQLISVVENHVKE
jgi:ArsR family transcriptional regulator